MRLIRSSRLSSGLRRRPAVMHDQVALGDRLVAGRADPLIGDERGAVQQVEGLAADLVGVQVDQVDLADHAAALQGKGRATSRPGRRRR